MAKRLIAAPGLCSALALAFLVQPQPAHAQLTRGVISGTVTDTSGAAVPGATARVRNLDTNIVRAAITNTSGFYRIPALEPGRYSVLIEMPGFSSAENKDIRVQTSQEVTFDVGIKVSTVTETVDVTSESAAVLLNKSNPTIGYTATARQAVDLPLSAARDVNNLALLSPNTFQAPGSTGISANGNRARNNNFTIDGSDNNDISVTLSTTPVIPEAVAEFQNQTNAYNAEFGRNSGAQLNVITRSGTNQFHGDVFEYYRGSTLNSRDNLEKAAGRTDPTRENRNQAGFALGGPIVGDKTFFFVLGQIDRTRAGGTQGATITLPTQTGFAALQGVPLRDGQSAASRQAVLNNLGFLTDVYSQNLLFRNVRTTLVNGVPIEIGQINVPRSQPDDRVNVVARVDHRLSAKDSATARFIYNRRDVQNFVSNTNFGALFAGAQNTNDSNLALSETHIFSGDTLNEARFSYIRRNLQFPENDPDSPSATITGFFTVGGASNFPQGRIQNSFQLSDVLTFHRGRHAFKVGTDIRRIVLDNQAAFDSKGTFTFSNFQDYMNNTAARFAQALQTSSFTARQWQTFWFAQDDFRVTPDLTVNLGLRYELSSVPLGFFGAEDPASLGALVPPPVQRDSNNIAPRLGFNWSPKSDGGLLGNSQTVIRGGYGRSFDVLFYNILTVNASNYPRVVVGEQFIVRDVYPNLAPVSGAAVFDPLATYVNTPEDAQNPEVDFYSLSAQREFGRDFVVEIGYTGNRGRHGINQLQANPSVLTPAQAALVASTGSVNAIPGTQARRENPAVGSRVLIATTAKSSYNAGFVSVNKRMSHGIQFGASYTRSRLMSDNDESLGVADIVNGSPQVPQDYRNIDAEWSLSAFDRTHRFVVNYIWEVPLFNNSRNGVLRSVLGGWQIAGVTQAQSGQPFTIFTGVDSNGNGTAGGDRPNLVPGCSPLSDPDSGDFKTFLPNDCFAVPRGTNGLPLANSLGNGNLPRNTFRSAAFWNTDLSLSKKFRISDDTVTLRADFLNVFNQDEYGLPVANMSSVTFGQNIRDWGQRSITLGLKYSF